MVLLLGDLPGNGEHLCDLVYCSRELTFSLPASGSSSSEIAGSRQNSFPRFLVLLYYYFRFSSGVMKCPIPEA